jgi:hypothetical protein
MNPDPIHNAATDATSFFASLLHSVPDTSAIWPGEAVDDGSGLLMPALAGVAAAMTVAFMLGVYFQTGYRSYRDMIRHGLTAALGLSLLAFVVTDMRNAALAHIARTQFRPAAQFEWQWRQTTERARELAAEMGHTEMSRAFRPSPEAHQG